MPYDPVTPARLMQFLERLGRTYRRPGRVYLVGSTGLLFQGLKAATKDVDLTLQVPATERDRLGEVVRQIGRELNMAIEEVSPGDFIPLPSGQPRHLCLRSGLDCPRQDRTWPARRLR